KTLDQAIGVGDQAKDQLNAFLPLEVDAHDRTAVAIEIELRRHDEEGLFLRQALDAQHLGAELGQDQPGKRHGTDARHLDDTQPGKGGGVYVFGRRLRAQDGLLRRHADGTVETDHLAVEHLVLDDVAGEGAILGRLAQTGRERHLLAERVLRFLRKSGQHRGAEDAGSDRHHADAGARQVSRYRQRHAHHAALGGRIGSLADLSVEGGDRGGVDDDAALATFKRLELFAAHGKQADHVECADQVDLDHLAVVVERVRPVLRGGACGDGDAGAVDQDARGAELFGDRGEGLLATLGRRDVAPDRDPADVGRNLFGAVDADIEDRDLRAPGGKRPRRRLAQARTAAGDDGNLTRWIHDFLRNVMRQNNPAPS